MWLFIEEPFCFMYLHVIAWHTGKCDYLPSCLELDEKIKTSLTSALDMNLTPAAI